MITMSPTKRTGHQANLKLNESNDYEEISNFAETTADVSILKTNNDDAYLYQTLYNCKSSSIKRIRTLNCATSTLNHKQQLIRKHDYSVNEIFKNLEEFNKDANEQENLILKRSRRQAAHSYVNDKISNIWQRTEYIFSKTVGDAQFSCVQLCVN